MGARSIPLRSFWDLAHQVLGRLPWSLRSSGELCPQWAGEVDRWTYHIITPILLPAVVTLYVLTVRHKKLLSLHTLLFVGSAALLLMYLRDTAAYQVWQIGLCLTSAALLDSPWWMGHLQWLRLAPHNRVTALVKHAQRGVAAGRSQP